MLETDYIRVEDGDVSIQGASENTSISGSPATYAALGCIIGDFNISDGKDTKSVAASNWCTAVAASVLNQNRVGNRNVSMSFTLEMDLSDTATKEALAAYKASNPFFIKAVGTDNNSTSNSITDEFQVLFTQFDKNYQQEGTARFSVAATVTNILSDAVIAP